MGWITNLDRRVIFIIMGVAVAAPVLLGLKFPEKPTAITHAAFDVVEKLPPGAQVLIALDYDPAGMSELHPMSAALTRHVALRQGKIYFLTLWPTGTRFIDDMTRLLSREFPDLKYGEDYVNLGYGAGEMGVIKIITSDLQQQFRNDVRQTPLSSLPMTAGVKNIREMDLIIDISAGTPGAKEWVQYASTAFSIPTVAGTTGVQTPMLMPYLPNQLNGILGGIKAAAEYEVLLANHYPQLQAAERIVAEPGLFVGTVRMGPQLVAHLLMIVLIILGNISYFAARRTGSTV